MTVKKRLNLKNFIYGYWFIWPFAILVGIAFLHSGSKSDNGNNNNSTSPQTNTSSSNNTQTNPSKYSAVSDPGMFSASQLFSEIDGFRIYGGVVALQEDPSLDGAANLRAYQIQQNGTSYQSDSNSIFKRISNAVPATTYGQEIYQPLCDGATTGSVYTSLVGSDSIYQALNNPKYTVAGVGVLKSNPGGCDGYAVIELSDVN